MARSLSQQAWESARTMLASEHPADFARLLAQEREALGLEVSTSGVLQDS